MIALFVVGILFFAPPLAANDVVAQKIDAAIQFANAGRDDLALQLLQKVLQTKLTSVEKAGVLYNIAVVFARGDRYWEAMTALNQIDDAMFDKVLEITPIEAVQIAYNGALCSVAFAKNQIGQLASGNSYTQNDLDHISQALASAIQYNTKLDELFKNKALLDIPREPFLARIGVEEEIANITVSLKKLQERLSVERLDKTALLEELGASLQEQFFSLLGIYLSESFDEQAVGLYMQAQQQKSFTKISLAIDRLLQFLQAPGKKKTVSMQLFLQEEIQKLQEQLRSSFVSTNIVEALSTLDELSSMVLLVQAEVAKREIVALLDGRTEVAMEYLLAKRSQKLLSFWQDQWQVREQFVLRFLTKKASTLLEPDSKLVLLLQKKIDAEQNKAPSVQVTVDDAFYWKILSQKENKTYLDLAMSLHGIAKVDYVVLKKIVNALLDRVDVLQQEEAKAPLIDMLTMQSPLLLFQDAVESWFYVDSKAALSFMFDTLIAECSQLQLNPTMDSFLARTDYHLVMHLVGILIKEGDLVDVAEVYDDLMKKISWFSTREKKDFDFFTMNLQLSWLKEKLVGQTKNLEGITAAVDFAVEFQKKTMSLVRYSKDTSFQQTLNLLSQMQQQLTHKVADALDKLDTKGPKIKQVITLVAQAEENTKRQNKELASMQAVLNDLQKASEILHSMKSKSEDESESSKASPQLEGGASEQMEKQALKLAPELSIRLLQEMERQDKSLKTQNIPQASGLRPW